MSLFNSRSVTKWLVASVLIAVLTACGGPEARKAKALAAGQAFLEEGNLDKARIELRNVRQIDPNDSEARYLSGVIAERLDNMRQAAGHYRGTLDIDPEHARARAALGRLYVMAGLPNDAIALVETNMDSNLTEAPLLAVRGAALSQLGMTERALEDARAAVLDDPTHEQGVALLGGVLTSLDEFEEAATALEAGIALNPDSRDLRIARALLAEKTGDRAAALEQYRELITSNPDNVEIRYQAAAYYLRTGDTAEAEQSLRSAVTIADDAQSLERLVEFIESQYGFDAAEKELSTRAESSPRARLQLADFYRANTHVDEAMATYLRLAEEMPRAPEAEIANARLAAMHIANGERQLGYDRIETVLKDNPRSAEALLVRGSLAVSENRPDDAIVDFRMLIRNDPEVIAYHLGIAQAYLLKGQTTLAEQAMRDAVKTQPNNLKARVDLAQFLARHGKPDAADDLIRSVIVRAPDSVIARDTAVRIAVTQGNWSEALERARAIVEIAPDNYVGYHLSGLSLEGLSRETEAVVAYEQALERKPDAADVLAAWGRVQVRNGNADEVLARVENIPESSDSIAAIHNLHAEVLSSQGMREEAASMAEKAIAANPGWWMPYMTLARTVDSSSQKAAVLQRGFDRTASPPQLGIELAGIYERDKQPEKAISVYESMIENNAFSDVLANNLAMLLATYRTDSASLQRALSMTQQFASTDNPAFLNTFGWTRLKSGELDKALPALQQAVNMQPNSAILRYHLGIALDQKGDADGAQEQFSRALEIGDQFPGAEDARARLSRT